MLNPRFESDNDIFVDDKWRIMTMNITFASIWDDRGTPVTKSHLVPHLPNFFRPLQRFIRLLNGRELDHLQKS